MPTILILVPADADADEVALAEAAMEGARSVRFAEVEVRRTSRVGEAIEPESSDSSFRNYSALTAADTLTTYDAILSIVPRSGAGATAWMGSQSLADIVGAAIATEEARAWEALSAMGRAEMILLGPGGSDPSRARTLGARAVTVASWVRHAKGHEHRD